MNTENKEITHSTTDYSSFNYLTANRTVRDTSELINSIRVFGQLSPVIVNEKMEVIDGQHRIRVCKSLDIPVIYIIKEGYTLKQVMELNKTAKNWVLIDYMNSHAIEGNQNYKIFKKFRSKFGFQMSTCIALLTGCTEKKTGTEREFKDGSFVISTLRDATSKAIKITQIGKYFPDYKHREFVLTMSYVLGNPEFDFDKFIYKLSKKRRGYFYVCKRRREYLSLIQNLYNFGETIKVGLF